MLQQVAGPPGRGGKGWGGKGVPDGLRQHGVWQVPAQIVQVSLLRHHSALNPSLGCLSTHGPLCPTRPTVSSTVWFTGSKRSNTGRARRRCPTPALGLVLHGGSREGP